MAAEVFQGGRTAEPFVGNGYLSFGRQGAHLPTGHDRRFAISPIHDRVEMFDINPVPNPIICDFIQQQIDPGIRQFANVPYPVSIGGSELFYIGNLTDVTGSREWRARVYLHGIYAGYGAANSDPYSGQHETTGYVKIAFLPWNGGSAKVSLLHCGEEQKQMEDFYNEMRMNLAMRKRVMQVNEIIAQFRRLTSASFPAEADTSAVA